MGAIGWILAGVGVLLVNGLIWVVLYQREVRVLLERVAHLENRLANGSERGSRSLASLRRMRRIRAAEGETDLRGAAGQDLTQGTPTQRSGTGQSVSIGSTS